MHENHAEQPPVLAAGHRRLVEHQQVGDRVALRTAHHLEEPDRDRDRQDRVGDDGLVNSAGPGAAEVPACRALVAQLLAEPAEPGGDLGLGIPGSTAIGLPVGVQGAPEIALADAGGGQLAPGDPAQGRVGRLRGQPPRLDRGVVLVHPVTALGKPEQRGNVEIRVTVADHPRVERGGLLVLALGGQGVGTLDQRQGSRSIERAGGERVAGLGAGIVSQGVRRSRWAPIARIGGGDRQARSAECSGWWRRARSGPALVARRARPARTRAHPVARCAAWTCTSSGPRTR